MKQDEVSLEIVVVDGASTDQTRIELEYFSDKFINFKYISLEVNGGIDEDFSKSITFARGEYCWLMSDDDLICDSAIIEVISHLRSGYLFMVINSKHMSSDMSFCIDENRLKVKENKCFDSTQKNEMFAELAGPLGLISCLVVRRDYWMRQDIKRYCGTSFNHIGVVFQTPVDGSVLLIAKTLIYIRQGNLSWTKNAFRIWNIDYPNLIWSIDCFHESVKLKVISREPWRNIKTLILFKSMGYYSRSDYFKFIHHSSASALMKFSAFSLSIFNYKFIGFFGYIYLILFKRSSKTTMYDLLQILLDRSKSK